MRDGEAALLNVPAGKVTFSVLSGRRQLCEQMLLVQNGGSQDGISAWQCAGTNQSA